MKLSKTISSILLLLTITLPLTPTLAKAPLKKSTPATHYAIKFHRPFKVGLQYTISESVKLNTTSYRNGSLSGTQAQDLCLDGTINILAVDDYGFPQKLTCTVTKCTNTDNPLISPGKSFTAELISDSPTFSGNNFSLSSAAYDALRSLIAFHKKKLPTDDQVFGTTKPQRLGSKWGINGSLANSQWGLEGSNITGFAQASRLEKLNGIDCLLINTSMTLGGESSGQIKCSGDFPLDLSIIPQKETILMDTTIQRGDAYARMKITKVATYKLL